MELAAALLHNKAGMFSGVAGGPRGAYDFTVPKYMLLNYQPSPISFQGGSGGLAIFVAQYVVRAPRARLRKGLAFMGRVSLLGKLLEVGRL